MHEPVAEKITSHVPHDAPEHWDKTRARLESGQWYWLTTIMPDGKPHVRPILAVWTDDRLCFVSTPGSRKARNLAENPCCTITLQAEDSHIVAEGTATVLQDTAQIERVAAVYDSKYGWRVEVRDGMFYADGAPTAGEPPFAVYEMTFDKIFAFGTEESFSPTRYRFPAEQG